MKQICKIIFFCVLTRLFLFSLLFLFKGKDLDSSSAIYLGIELECNYKDRFLLSLARWDAVQFCIIAEKGYKYESQHAFFPVYPILSQKLGFILKKILLNKQKQTDVFSIRKLILFSGILISNFFFILSAIILFYLSLTITKTESISFLSSILFSIQPASVFLSSMYTESLFVFLCFTGMLLYKKEHRIVPILLWSIATATRSNGITMGGFFLYSFLLSPKMKNLFWSFFGLFSIIFSFFIVDYFTYYKTSFKKNNYSFIKPFYFEIQRKYWDVGILSYYKKENIPNILIVLPTIVFSFSGIISYFWNYKKEKKGFFSKDVFPYAVLWLFMLFYLLLMVHVHIINRLFSFIPIIYWYSAHLIINEKKYFVLFWFIFIFSSYTLLFSHFYPPC